jgi:hypothetical protein
MAVCSFCRSTRASAGDRVAPVLARRLLYPRVMKDNKLIKWLGALALVVTVGGVLSGCYVETRRPHYWHRPVVIVR